MSTSTQHWFDKDSLKLRVGPVVAKLASKMRMAQYTREEFTITQAAVFLGVCTGTIYKHMKRLNIITSRLEKSEVAGLIKKGVLKPKATTASVITSWQLMDIAISISKKDVRLAGEWCLKATQSYENSALVTIEEFRDYEKNTINFKRLDKFSSDRLAGNFPGAFDRYERSKIIKLKGERKCRIIKLR